MLGLSETSRTLLFRIESPLNSQSSSFSCTGKRAISAPEPLRVPDEGRPVDTHHGV